MSIPASRVFRRWCCPVRTIFLAVLKSAGIRVQNGRRNSLWRFFCRSSRFPMWGGKAFLHRKNARFSPLDKIGAQPSDTVRWLRPFLLIITTLVEKLILLFQFFYCVKESIMITLSCNIFIFFEVYHTLFPPAVSSEVPLAGQSCGRRVRPGVLLASRRKEVW